MTGKTKKAGKSSRLDKCRQWLWSELHPTNPSDPPKPNPWVPNGTGGTAAAITKSWLPACGGAAHQHPRLRHVAAGPSSKRTAGAQAPPSRKNVFIKASLMMLPQIKLPPNYISDSTSTNGNNDMQLSGILGPTEPSSALTVQYAVHRRITPSSFSYDHVSIAHEFTTADPFDAEGRPMEFTSAAHCGGKLYATSLQGAVAAMEVVDTRLEITRVGEARAVPSSDSGFFRECLFEMKGEILLVFLIHERCVEVVDFVEVFRLDLERLCWVKVERLQGKTVFLKERCVWVQSEEFGCRDDRVYFTQGMLEKSWRVWDMKIFCILPVSPWVDGVE